MGGTYKIPFDHPCLAGHFPGNPIVPGVVLLDKVRELLESVHPNYYICNITHVKFHHPLGPEQTFTISLREAKNDTFVFECNKEDIKLSSGKITIKPRT